VNDTKVSKVDLSLVLKQQAYMLFYKLRPAPGQGKEETPKKGSRKGSVSKQSMDGNSP